MQRNDNTEEKATKTALLLGAINLLVAPAYNVNTSVGLLITIVANAFSIYKFHELGKERRAGANALTSVHSTVSSYTSSFLSFFSPRNEISASLEDEANKKEMDTAGRNIINGGAAIADKIAGYINAMKPRR